MSEQLLTATITLTALVDAPSPGSAKRYGKNHLDLSSAEGFGWKVQNIKVEVEKAPVS